MLSGAEVLFSSRHATVKAIFTSLLVVAYLKVNSEKISGKIYSKDALAQEEQPLGPNRPNRLEQGSGSSRMGK